MTGLTTDLISNACRIYFSLAYPNGEHTVPAARRLYADLPPGHDVFAYHAQQPFPAASFQVWHSAAGGVQGVALRLGCAHFHHLKLRVQALHHRDEHLWLFSVDTHDSFPRHLPRPPAGHPDAVAWENLHRANAALKEKIESAWEEAGLLTFNGLLRRDLERAPV